MAVPETYQISASRFNQIPHIDDQSIPSISQLLGIGEILVYHKANDRFGVHLLHRHFEIDNDTVMFGFVDGDKEYSKMTKLSDLDPQKLRPQCFLFDSNEGFVPYEYKYGDGQSEILPALLSEDLGKHFMVNNLQHLFAIERLQPSASRADAPFCREYPAEAFATVRVPVEDGIQALDKDTAWVFRAGEDGQIITRTTCSWRAGC